MLWNLQANIRAWFTIEKNQANAKCLEIIKLTHNFGGSIKQPPFFAYLEEKRDPIHNSGQYFLKFFFLWFSYNLYGPIFVPSHSPNSFLSIHTSVLSEAPIHMTLLSHHFLNSFLLLLPNCLYPFSIFSCHKSLGPYPTKTELSRGEETKLSSQRENSP